MAPNNHHHGHYDTNRYAGDQAADTRRAMNHMPDEDRVPTANIQQSINQDQSQTLSQDVRMGDDRAIGDTPNWANYDSEMLYKFATDKNSPYTADDLGRAFNDGGNRLAEAANGLLDAVSRLDGSWTGVAADSAKGALKPLASAAGTAGTTAQLMGVRMSQQSVAASEVQKLPPPKTFDNQQSLNAMMAGGPAAMQADLRTQKDAADAVKREQISYLNTYTSSMSSVDSQTPSFVPPESRIGGGGSNSNSITGGNVVIPGTGNGAPSVRGTTTGAPSSKYTGVNGPNGAAPGVSGDDNGQTDQSGYTPLPGMGTGSSGYTPPSTTPTPSTFGPSGGGAGGANVPGAGSGGFGGGFGSFGGAGAGGAGAGAGAGSGSGSGGNAGARPMGPGGMGASGPGGAGGRGMGGGAPRGKGEGDEDKEHERPSYLVEGDPESAFGNDQLTAPPVIGGDG